MLIEAEVKKMEIQLRLLTGQVNKLEGKVKASVRFDRDVPFKKLHPDAVAPKYYSDGAAAFDLHPLITDGDVIRVNPHSQKIIPTGIAFSVPDGFELRISPRSGQSANYRGEIMVIFVNNKDTVHVITID